MTSFHHTNQAKVERQFFAKIYFFVMLQHLQKRGFNESKELIAIIRPPTLVRTTRSYHHTHISITFSAKKERQHIGRKKLEVTGCTFCDTCLRTSMKIVLAAFVLQNLTTVPIVSDFHDTTLTPIGTTGHNKHTNFGCVMALYGGLTFKSGNSVRRNRNSFKNDVQEGLLRRCLKLEAFASHKEHTQHLQCRKQWCALLSRKGLPACHCYELCIGGPVTPGCKKRQSSP